MIQDLKLPYLHINKNLQINSTKIERFGCLLLIVVNDHDNLFIR